MVDDSINMANDVESYYKAGGPDPSDRVASFIKAAILRGEAIAGAKIVRKDRLEIK
jgi:hypothetical protein